MIGVNQGPHDGADIERMLAGSILLIREQVPQAGEIAVLGARTEIWRVAHITCCRVGGV